MSRYILKALVTVERKQEFYVLTVPKSAELEWCVALVLLSEGVADIIANGDRKLSLAVDDKLTAAMRGAVDMAKGVVRLRLSRTELHSWLHFFLKAVRDGAPDVDHLDCEFRGGQEPADIVLAVEGAKSPMSAEAARRQLGL